MKMNTEYQPKKRGIGIVTTLALAGLAAITAYTGWYIAKAQQRAVKTVDSAVMRSYHTTLTGKLLAPMSWGEREITFTDGTKHVITFLDKPFDNIETRIDGTVLLPGRGDVWEVNGHNKPVRAIYEMPEGPH